MDRIEGLNQLIVAVGLAGGILLVNERARRDDGKLTAWPLAMAMLLFSVVGLATYIQLNVETSDAAEVKAGLEALQNLFVLMILVLIATALRRLYHEMIARTQSTSGSFKTGAAFASAGVAIVLAAVGLQLLFPLLGRIDGPAETVTLGLFTFTFFSAIVIAANGALNTSDSSRRELNTRLLRRTDAFDGDWVSASAVPMHRAECDRDRVNAIEFPVWEYNGQIYGPPETQRQLLALHRDCANRFDAPSREFLEVALIARWSKGPDALEFYWRPEAVRVTNAAFPIASIRFRRLISLVDRRKWRSIAPLSTIEIKTRLRRVDVDLFRRAGIDLHLQRPRVAVTLNSKTIDRRAELRS